MVRELMAKDFSERQACKWVGMSRSVFRYEPTIDALNPVLAELLKEGARRHPAYGYRRQHVLLLRQGFGVNPKRTERLWRQLELTLPRRRKKKRRLGPKGEVKMRARYPNHVWTYDFAFDGLVDGRPLKILVVLDEFPRKCLAILVARSIVAEDLIEVLETLVAKRGAPEFIRSDNGPEFISKKVIEWLASIGTNTIFIHPGSPWENPYIESFIGKFRDECLNREWFFSLEEARYVIEEWRREYNEFRPHSSLGNRTPAKVDACPEGASSATLRTPLRSIDEAERLTF